MSKEIQEAVERIKSIRQTISSWVFNDNTSDKVRENDLKDLQSIDLLLQDHDKQSKIINLMTKYISKQDNYKGICKKTTEEDCYADIYQENACINCIKEYFENKAKES